MSINITACDACKYELISNASRIQLSSSFFVYILSDSYINHVYELLLVVYLDQKKAIIHHIFFVDNGRNFQCQSDIIHVDQLAVIDLMISY